MVTMAWVAVVIRLPLHVSVGTTAIMLQEKGWVPGHGSGGE